MTFDWTKYAIGGATRPDGISGLQADFRDNLQQFLTAADAALGPGMQVYSGYRSPELQGQLYQNALEKYGDEATARKWVAPPGKSQHNHGNAADLKFNGNRLDQSPEAAAWVAENAPQYGLAVPMSWEPWQVEAAGARGQQSAPVQAPVNALDPGKMDKLAKLNALAAFRPQFTPLSMPMMEL